MKTKIADISLENNNENIVVANEENLQPQILILLIKIKENLSIKFQKLEKTSKINPRENKRDQIINIKSESNEF